MVSSLLWLFTKSSILFPNWWQRKRAVQRLIVLRKQRKTPYLGVIGGDRRVGAPLA